MAALALPQHARLRPVGGRLSAAAATTWPRMRLGCRLPALAQRPSALTLAACCVATRSSPRLLHTSAALSRSRAHRDKRKSKGKRPSYTTTETGLQYLDELVGNGETPKPGCKVTVHYTGSLPNGRVFDSSLQRGPFSFKIGAGQVIAGWDEGIMSMR
jgi:hypothetical protein